MRGWLVMWVVILDLKVSRGKVDRHLHGSSNSICTEWKKGCILYSSTVSDDVCAESDNYDISHTDISLNRHSTYRQFADRHFAVGHFVNKPDISLTRHFADRHFADRQIVYRQFADIMLRNWQTAICMTLLRIIDVYWHAIFLQYDEKLNGQNKLLQLPIPTY